MGKKKGGVRMKQVGPKMPSASAMSSLLNPMEGLMGGGGGAGGGIPQDEMIHLPPPPDRNYQVFWPMHETFTMDVTGFQIIHPSYLDSQKTIKMGRRLPAGLCVPKPTVIDLSHALSVLQVRHVVQPYKGYSRDITCQWDNPGRVKVDIKKSIFANKIELMKELCTIIPTLPERQSRIVLEQQQQQKEDDERKAAIEAENQQSHKKTITAGTNTTTASSSNKKSTKKGKKK